MIEEVDDDANQKRHRLSELFSTAPQGAVAGLSERTRSLLSPAVGDGVTQIRLTPNVPGASIEHSDSSSGLRVLPPAQRELTRQERRRLQKKLKRAKGLA